MVGGSAHAICVKSVLETRAPFVPRSNFSFGSSLEIQLYLYGYRGVVNLVRV